MSRQVIDHSPDLARLRAEKYEIQVHPSNHLVVRNIPYVTVDKTVAYGVLIVPIVKIENNVVGRPPNHQAYFAGTFPHSNLGEPLTVVGVPNSSQKYELGGELEAQFYLSYKSPKINPEIQSYNDYHDLVTSYVEEMSKYAIRVDSSATPLTGRVRDYDEEPSVFVYRDTASTRAGIAAVSEKVAGHTIAIIGVGGTGSYVLDLVSKTPVKEIHLFDGDRFSQHNAFRSPSAADEMDVFAVPPHYKVDYFCSRYSKMHKAIIPHAEYVNDLPELFDSIDFTFLCIDKAAAKRNIVDGLVARKKPFIDVGMGINLEDRSLSGLLRTTLSTEQCRTHRHPIAFVDVEDDYATNIQIADLNALNAALAVVRWKKMLGFYHTNDEEFSSIYTVDFNRIDNAGCGA